MKLYRILSVLFWAIRQFVIPNPFEVLGDGVTVIVNGNPLLLSPDVLNWIAGFALPGISFTFARLYYLDRSVPAIGSALYMFFFCVHTGILHLMSSVYPAIWLIIIIGVVYVGLYIGVYALVNRFFEL